MHKIIGSPILKAYTPAQNVQIGDKVFNNIDFSDTRNYMQDNVRHSVNYLESQNADYSVYVAKGKVIRTHKEYRRPVSKTIGGQVYDKIISVTTRADGYKQYENKDTEMLRTLINVNDKGDVIKIIEPFELKVMKKFSKLMDKLPKFLK